MASFKDWLQLGRAHTASLTIPAVLLGVTLAGSTNILLYVVLAMWAWCFHYFGCCMNAVFDYQHDRADPSKQHHPLVTGLITYEDALRVTAAGMLTLTLAGGAIWVAMNTRNPGSLTANLTGLTMYTAILGGVIYNLTCKRTLLAPVFIAFSFASLPLFGYFSAGGSPWNPVIWYVSAFAFLMIPAQIAFSGYLKDLDADPVNLLKTMGAQATPCTTCHETGYPEGVITHYTYKFPKNVRAFAWATRLLTPAIAILWILLHPNWFSFSAWCILTALTITIQLEILHEGKMARSEKLRLIGYNEVAAYITLIISLTTTIGWLAAWYITLPLTYYAIMNRALWQDASLPRV